MDVDDVDDVERAESGGSSARDTVQAFKAEVYGTDWIELFKGFITAIAVLPVALLSPLVTALPPAWKLYHKLHVWSAWQMQKASNADVLANVRHPNGKEDVRPAQYVEGSEDENDRTGWKVKGLGDKRYAPGINGGESNRMGKADLIHINEDDTRQGSWAEAAVDTAFAADRERYLFRDATVSAKQITLDATGAGGPAIADGGENVRTANVSIERPGVLEDVLVPITSAAGFDGQAVSWAQFSNVAAEKADQETIREAKNSGWMAAKMDDVGGVDLLKWALIIGVWSFILLFHNDIGAFISGVGGGDAVGNAASGAGLGVISYGKLALGMV